MRPLLPVEQSFFRDLFAAFSARGLPTLLLRNYEEFPATIGHDLDVFFRRGDLADAVEVFAETLARHGGEQLHVHERDYVRAVWVRIGAGLPMHFDFYHGAFTWHGRAFLDETAALEQSRSHGEFRVLRPAHEALTLVCISLLWGGFFKERYRERIAAMLADPTERAEFEARLPAPLGFDPARDAADKNRDAASAARLRAALPGTLDGTLRYWTGEAGTLLRPPGLCVAFLGPDGAGKSTLIEAFRAVAEPLFGAVDYHHWRPNVLPDIGIALGKRRAATGPVTDPHSRPPHRPAMSLARLLYYVADYWLGWPLRVLKPRAQNRLVIFDRFAPDMACDPRRYRFALPGWLLAALTRCVPQPDVGFVLVADAETLQRRKAEVPREALEAMLPRYRALGGSGWIVLDVTRPVAELAEEIQRHLLAALRAKLR